jgi:hypothetical protein
MDLVHGRRARPSLLQRHRPRTISLGAQSFGARPTVMLAWRVADHGPLSTGMAILVVRFAWCCFVDHL